MRKILFAVTFLASCGFVALAQDARTASAVLRQNPQSYRPLSTDIWGLPAVPGRILFYGGDINPDDPNAQGFANGNTLIIANTSTYGAVIAPNRGRIVTAAVFFNVSALLGVFDPPVGTYDVRTGVSDGDCGTDVAQGSGPQTATPTGRTPFGLPEYTTTVSFSKPLTAHHGTTYWVNETPQCTNTGDANCSAEFYYLSNTTQQTNGVNANAQPSGQLYMNSSYFGLVCGKVCDASAPGCRASWGLLR